MKPLPPVVVLTGPTGAGKTQLALELAARQPVELINMDSAQVYRGLDIGTAKPDAATRAQVVHHLIDIRDPAQSYNAGEFVRDAQACIQDVHQRGRVPVLVGGSLLYLRALRRGLASLPEADAAVRQSLEARAAKQGWAALHAELARVDPTAAARIHANDAQRIQRALEVYQLTGRPISSLQSDTQGLDGAYRWLAFALVPGDRGGLQVRLGHRFRTMLEAGLVQEVRALYQRGDLTDRHPAVRSVGYRQLWRHLAGELSLQEATAAAITATCQLAKRQMTWLRSETGLVSLDPVQLSSAEKVFHSVARAAEPC